MRTEIHLSGPRRIRSIQTTVRQRGVTLFGLMFWAIIVGFSAVVMLRVLPTLNEFFTIRKAIEKVSSENLNTVSEIRLAFDKQKEVEYSIQTIGGRDLKVTKDDGKVVISFAYAKEIVLIQPVYLLIKYEGHSK